MSLKQGNAKKITTNQNSYATKQNIQTDPFLNPYGSGDHK